LGVACGGTTTPEDPPSDAPSIAATVGDGQVTLRWFGLSEAASYNLYWSATSPLTETTATRISGLKETNHSGTFFYIHGGLTNGTPYHYVVAAENAAGEGPRSAEVSATPLPFEIMSAGFEHALAIRSDGTLWGWGLNLRGQVGVDRTDALRVDTIAYLSPAQIGTAHDWVAVSAGGAHSLALKADGSLWAWGENDAGQLGLGDTSDRSSPVRVGSADDWAAISAGSSSTPAHSLALKSDGSLWAWGSNSSRQLGLQYSSGELSPVRVDTANDWVAASAGVDHTLAVRANGTLWAWGDNYVGQLGLGDNLQWYSSGRWHPVQVGTATDWVGVSAGDFFSVAVKADGSVWAWGSNFREVLGPGYTGPPGYESAPVRIGSSNDWARVDAGQYYNLAVRSDGTLWGWGANVVGNLGLGDRTDRSSPTQVGAASDWTYVSAGGTWQSLALKSDGSLWLLGTVAWDVNGALIPVRIR
jgi:alpha-tubulin suppressor-like RCC1 family protein